MKGIPRSEERERKKTAKRSDGVTKREKKGERKGTARGQRKLSRVKGGLVWERKVFKPYLIPDPF